MAWLRPVQLVERVGRGYFKLNDRGAPIVDQNVRRWNDLESAERPEVYGDKFRIKTLRYFLEAEGLRAIQLVFENLEEPEDVVFGPIRGRSSGVEWTNVLELGKDQMLIGMRFSTRTGTAFALSNTPPEQEEFVGKVWKLPLGFRIYGFHGTFDETGITFLGPIFKPLELKQWNTDLYRNLPRAFRLNFRLLILIKNRHRNSPPGIETLDFWQMPEVAWDNIIQTLLSLYYYEMDSSFFLKDISYFR